MELYRFGGNKPALAISAVAILLGLFTAFGAFTLEDKAECVPSYAGTGQPNIPGKVIVGQVVEREERLSGCKSIAVRVNGRNASKFTPSQQAFDAAINAPPADPETSAVLVLNNLPARYDDLQNGTKLMALYDETREAPYAFYFPSSNGGLELGPDLRSDYSKTRLMLYVGTGLLLFIGIGILLVIWRYPVRWNPPARSATVSTPRPPRPKRPKADPITGERLPEDEPPPRPRFKVKSEPLPPGAEDDNS